MRSGMGVCDWIYKGSSHRRSVSGCDDTTILEAHFLLDERRVERKMTTIFRIIILIIKEWSEWMRVGMCIWFSKSKTNEFQKNKKNIAKVMLQVCCCVVCVWVPCRCRSFLPKAKDLHSGPTGNPKQSECGRVVVRLLLVCGKWMATLCIFLCKLRQSQCCQLHPRVTQSRTIWLFFHPSNQWLIHLRTCRPLILKQPALTAVRVHRISSRWRCNIIYRPSGPPDKLLQLSIGIGAS